jgi:uncharacterized SAM-binding protein YcdF (DUF218 family)
MDFAFILKKIISAMIMPLSIALLLGIIGLIYLYINKYKQAKIFLSISIVLVACFSYVPFSNILMTPLETKYKPIQDIPKDVKYILLLGGDRYNRAWEALRLYHNIPDAKIITSGYAGRGKIPGAIKTANLLHSIGIPYEDIIIHKEPKDTKEEAMKIKETLGKQKFFLVTSAYHMPRALALFQKEGLEPIVAPVDYKIQDSDKIVSAPMGGILMRTEQAWHEYIGLLWSKLRGQI